MSFAQILVGLDLGANGTELTPGSRLALGQAESIARHEGAKLIVLHSTANDEHWDPDQGSYVGNSSDAATPTQATLAEVMRGLEQAGVEAVLELTAEKAWLAIVRKAIHEPIDLVVVAKRSHYLDDVRKLGSVSMKLLRHCPCPVWAVKHELARHIGHLVAATDFSLCGEAVVSHSLDIARRWGGVAHLVHSFQIPMDVQKSGESDAYVSATRATCLRQMQEWVAADGIDAGLVAYHVAPSSPTRAILAVCDRFNADLVVMGSVGRGGLPGVLIGNTAERLLGKLDCSLLVIKPADFVPALQI